MSAPLSVAQLLEQAKVAHEAYRLALPRHDLRTGQPSGGDPSEAAMQRRRAYTLTTTALDLDPFATDPAWRDGRDWDALLQWYDQEAQKDAGVPVFTVPESHGR
jgi:hypothetical protein